MFEALTLSRVRDVTVGHHAKHDNTSGMVYNKAMLE